MRKVVRFEKTVTKEDVESFVKITGDDNPIHTDPDDPSTAQVREKLDIQKACAHGPLITSLICKPIMEFGGPGTVLLETSSFRYLQPVQVGDTVVVTCRHISTLSGGRHKVEITVQNEGGENIIKPTHATLLILN